MSHGAAAQPPASRVGTLPLYWRGLLYGAYDPDGSVDSLLARPNRSAARSKRLSRVQSNDPEVNCVEARRWASI